MSTINLRAMVKSASFNDEEHQTQLNSVCSKSNVDLFLTQVELLCLLLDKVVSDDDLLQQTEDWVKHIQAEFNAEFSHEVI